MYRNLNSDKTIETIAKLENRIMERFPDSGLSKVCQELHLVARENLHKSEWIAKPNYWLRLMVASIIFTIILALIYTISEMDISIKSIDAGEMVQIIEAGLNDIVLIGAALFFLVTVEIRIKRARALAALHELRSIAHVIDMHQLTKDPSHLMQRPVLTTSSPERELDAFSLTRYLDYCSEMLSLTGKVAALYAQNFKDAVVLATVNELEGLTTSLSRKIWQKIMILHKLDERGNIVAK